MSWQYIASRLNGDGTETFLDWDLPLGESVDIQHALSGADAISCTIEPEVTRMKKNGKFILEPWSTAIYAQRDGKIFGGALLVDMSVEGQKISLETTGFTGYANGMPYNGDKVFRNEDPINIFRHIWSHLQGQKDGNLGLTLDSTTSPVRIGSPQDLASIALNGGSASDEAVVFGWFGQTMDLGKEMNDLAANTPFEYITELAWSGPRSIRKNVRIGFPRIGRRRSDLRFAVGENVIEEPEIEYQGDDYASDIWAFGAGEGRAMRKNLSLRRDTGRLRRVAVVTDKALQTDKAVLSLGEKELARRTGSADITSIEVSNHKNAALGTYGPGDEIRVISDYGQSKGLDIWARIVKTTLHTKTENTTIDLIRSDKVQ